MEYNPACLVEGQLWLLLHHLDGPSPYQVYFGALVVNLCIWMQLPQVNLDDAEQLPVELSLIPFLHFLMVLVALFRMLLAHVAAELLRPLEVSTTEVAYVLPWLLLAFATRLFLPHLKE